MAEVTGTGDESTVVEAEGGAGIEVGSEGSVGAGRVGVEDRRAGRLHASALAARPSSQSHPRRLRCLPDKDRAGIEFRFNLTAWSEGIPAVKDLL